MAWTRIRKRSSRAPRPEEKRALSGQLPRALPSFLEDPAP